MPEWEDMLSRAQNMRLGLDGIRAELQSQVATVRSGDGAVEVAANGLQRVIAVRVASGAWNRYGERELAEKIASTVNEALERARSRALKKLGDTFGTDLSNLSGLLGGFLGGGGGGGL